MKASYLDEVIGFHEPELEHLSREHRHDGVEVVARPHRQDAPGARQHSNNKRASFISVLLRGNKRARTGHLLGERLPNGERGAQEDVAALEEDEVPHAQHGRLGQARGEQREEPLHGEHVRERRLDAVRRPAAVARLLEQLEVARERRKTLAQQLAEHRHVHRQAAQVVREVPLGQDPFDQVDHHLVFERTKKN